MIAQGIGADGDMFDPHRVVVAVNEPAHTDDAGPDLELTLESGETWSVPLRDFREALEFAERHYWRDRDAAGPQEGE